MQEDIRDEVDRLRKDLHGLRADIGTLTRMVRENGSETVDDWRSRAKEEFRNRREQFKHKADDLREQAIHTSEQIEDGIGKYPYTSVATAFSVGFILSKILDISRRHH